MACKNFFCSVSILALVSLCFCLAGCGEEKKAETPKGLQVALAPVQEATVPIDATVPARLTAKETVEVRARVSGYVLEKKFTEGSFVEKNQELYKLDDRDLKAAVESAKADVSKADATWKNDDIYKDRMVKLAQDGSVSLQMRDNAVAKADSSLAALESAKANLEKAEINLGYATITAPVAGWIARSEVEVGSNVDVGNATLLTTIYNIDPIRAEFSVTDRDYARYMKRMSEFGRPSLAFTFSFGPDKAVFPEKGVMEMSDPVIDQKTGTLGVRATFPNPKGILRPGMFGNITVTAGAHQALLIPVVAVTDQQGSKIVYQVDENGILKATVVTLGKVVGDKQVVQTGLAAGEYVVVKGLVNARPGIPAIVEEAPVAPAAANNVIPATPDKAAN